MNKTNILVGAAVILSIVALIFNFAKVGPQGPRGNDGIGAVPGDTIESSCLTVNGSVTCSESKSYSVATSTLCAIRTPSATSTLVRFMGVPSNSTSTASLLALATSTTRFTSGVNLGTGTTSLLAVGTQSANASAAFIYTGGTATSTGGTIPASQGGNPNGNNSPIQTGLREAIGPNQWLVFWQTGGGVVNDHSGTGNVVSGRCTAVFQY